MFDQLHNLLVAQGANFRVIDHPAEGNSEKVAAVRGTEVGQGAKAMICTLKGADFYVMTVVPGDRKVDFTRVARQFGLSKTSLMPAEQAVEITGCVVGAIPPFSFHPQLRVVVDGELLKRYAEIAFNAGKLDKSIVLNSNDYLRIANPIVADITVTVTEPTEDAH